MLRVFHNHSSARTIEDTLHTHLLQANAWIGEMNLSQADYTFLCETVRELGASVTPLMSVTAMVFTARYANAEVDNYNYSGFWKHYARALGHTEASQTFQNREREQFRKARLALADKYGLYFPERGAVQQDVISGIYLHAILPRYLQDDFAHWLVGLFRDQDDWRRATEASVDEIVIQIAEYSARGYIVPRLRNFIQSEITRATAARLVQTLAICADLFLQDNQDINAMLAPIEHELWSQLEPVLLQQREQQRKAQRVTRQHQTSTRYAWNVATNTLALRVKHWRVASQTAPDRLIWAVDEAGLDDYQDRYVTLNPWQNGDDFEVDLAYISGIPVAGCLLALVDERDQVLAQRHVEALPDNTNNKILFFKMDTEHAYALHTPVTAIGDGEYLVTSEQSFTLQHPDGQPLLPLENFAPLSELAQGGYRYAARYNLHLPVDLIIGDAKTPIRNRRGVFSLRLEGETVPGLAAHRPFVFYGVPTLRLVNTAPIADDIRRLWLRVSTSMGDAHQRHLAEVNFMTDGDDLLLTLSELSAGTYTLRLLRGFMDALDEPLNLVILPSGVHITPPDTEGYCSVQYPPRALIQGVSVAQIDVLGGTAEVVADGVMVTWHDAPKPAQLLLLLGDTVIPMCWEVRWRHAWIDPAHTLLDLPDLQNVTLHLHGNRYEVFGLQVGDLPAIQVPLNAAGRYETAVRLHALYDTLRNYPSVRAQVRATDGKSTWPLFTFQCFQEAGITSLTQQALHTMRYLRQRSRAQDVTRHEPALLALPRERIDQALSGTISPEMRNVLNTLRDTRDAVCHLPDSLLPELVLQLRLSEQVTLNAHVHRAPHLVDQVQVTVHLKTGSHLHTVAFNGQYTAEPDSQYRLVLIPQTTNLKQCGICSALFDQTDKYAKLQHSHGRGWNVQHHDVTAERPLIAHIFYDPLGIPTPSPDFTIVLDRSTVQSWRTRDRSHLTRLQQGALLSRQHYQFASAEWIRCLGTKPGEMLESLVDPSHRLGKAFMQLRSMLHQHLESGKHESPACFMLNALLMTVTPTDSDFRNNRWLALDAHLMTLAILYRAAAYNVTPIHDLITREVEEVMRQAIINALRTCPQLTAWAFAWAELYLCYFDLPVQTFEDLS